MPEVRNDEQRLGAVAGGSPVAPQQGQWLSLEDELYLEIGRGLVKGTLQQSNDALRQLVTLSAAMLGGGIVWLTPALVDVRCKAPAVILFLFALVAAFVGALPYTASVQWTCFADVREKVARGVRWKTRLLCLSAGFLLVGLLVVLLGILSH